MYTIIYQSYQFLKFYIYIFFVFSSVMFLFYGKKNYDYVKTNQLEQSLCHQTHEDHITFYRT